MFLLFSPCEGKQEASELPSLTEPTKEEKEINKGGIKEINETLREEMRKIEVCLVEEGGKGEELKLSV